MALDAFAWFLDGGNPGAVPVCGESQDAQMAQITGDKNKVFDLSNWSFSVSQQVNIGSATGGVGTGKVEFQPFQIDKQIDQSSPFFFQTLAQGGHYDSVVLFLRKAGGTPGQSGTIYFRADFRMVFVTDIQWSHDDTAPKETIKFDYGALRICYSKQTRTGAAKKIETKYDADPPGGDSHEQWSKMLNSREFSWKEAIPE